MPNPLIRATRLEGLRARMLRGVSWNVAAAVADRGLALVLAVTISRALGLEGFGHYGILLTTVMMFSLTSGTGLGVTATRYVAELRQADPAQLGRVLTLLRAAAGAMALLLCVGLLLCAPFIARMALNAPALTDALRIIVLAVIPLQFQAVSLGVLQGAEAFRAITAARLSVGVLRFLTVAGGAWLGGLPGAAMGITASYWIEYLVFAGLARAELRQHGVSTGTLREAWSERRILIDVTLPVVLGSQVTAPFNWLSQAMLAWQPGGYAALGLFNAANQWRMLVIFVPMKANEVAVPILTNLLGNKDTARFRRLFWLNLALGIGLGLAIALAVSLAGPWLLKLYGRGFDLAWPVLIVLALTGVVEVAGTYFSGVLVSLNRLWVRTLSCVVWGATLVVASWFLIPSHLAMGFALAGLAAHGLQALLALVAVRRDLHPSVTLPNAVPVPS